MNILYISNVMEFGGVEKCIIQLAKGFKQNNKVVVCTAGGPLTKELEEISIKHYNILNTDSKNINTVFKNIRIIYNIIKDENIDIVHSHHRMTTLYCKILSKFLKFKLIHTQHLCIEDKIKLTKLTLKRLQVITVSNGAKENLISKYGLEEGNITTIYNTIEEENSNYYIDDKLIEFRKKGYFTIAQISRLVDYKGVYDFIEVAKKISDREKKINFVLIGNGPEEVKLKQLIKEYNLEERVFLLGNKENIINQLKYIDLVLLCSYIEGLPLVPLEAFSQGVPVIATNIGGTNEEIVNNLNGYIVKMKDINDFCDKILKIYKDDKLYNELRKNSIKVFKEKFNKTLYINKHKNYYSKI